MLRLQDQKETLHLADMGALSAGSTPIPNEELGHGYVVVCVVKNGAPRFAVISAGTRLGGCNE